MKRRHFLSLAWGIVFLSSASVATRIVACGLDWMVPQGHFGGVDEQGKLSYWEQIGELDLGKGVKIPLTIGFESSRNSASPYLGDGWILAFLESSIVQIDDKRFLMMQPDGWTSRFGRKQATDTTLQGEKGWLAAISGNQITVWAKCGWKLVFTDGKITSIQTPQNQLLTYNYEGNLIKQIDEDGLPLLNVITDPANGAVTGLSFNGKQVGLTEGQRPHIDSLDGKNVVGEVTQSLQTITFADGSVENLKFAVDSGLLPTLSISGIDNRSFTWDPASRLILKDNDWTYHIVPGDKPYSNAQIGRTNSNNQSEFWYSDSHDGQEVTQDIEGVKHIKQSFTSGILKGKIRKIEDIKDNVSTTSYSAGYDEGGHLIREQKGEYTISYNSLEKPTVIYKDGKLYWQASYDPSSKLTAFHYTQ